MWSSKFWKDLAERVLSTFAQSLVGALLVAQTGLLETEWIPVLSVAGMAALLAFLKGIGANYKNPETGASLNDDTPQVEEEVATP